jgi:hypothetical protein
MAFLLLHDPESCDAVLGRNHAKPEKGIARRPRAILSE